MMSPASLLARLGELKKWQEAQQERLMRQHNKRLQETSSPVLEGICRLEDDPEDKALSPPKDFQALLEEKLADDDANGKQDGEASKPKRAFLRKGAGLARFRMTLEDQKRKKSRVVRAKPPEVSGLDVPQVAVQTKDLEETPRSADSQVNCFNKRVIAQINRFTKERESNDDAAADKELLIFESLERRAMNSSFSSTNSSIVRMLSSTPQKTSPQKPCKPPTVEEDTNESELIENLIYKHLHCDNIESLLANLKNYEEGTSSSSSVTSDDVIADAQSEPPLVKQTKDVETNTEEEEPSEDANETTLTTKELLTQRLEELEKEIERFRFENGRVAQLRRDLEIEQREFQKEKRKFMEELENERVEMRFAIEEERKKLAKEKMVFEKYTREAKNRPNKQERAEISNLKIELANLKETQKLKDTKNSTTQARLRNQIKSLEKDKAHLEEEIEKLTKQNAKLVATQKINSRPTETKMLHEINKNLNRLAKSQDKKADEKEAKTNAFYGSGSKENDLNLLNADNSFEGFDIERHYEEVFGRGGDLKEQITVNESKKDDNCETILSDGSKEIKYANGNVKITSPDGNIIKTKYYNGDLKETNLKEGYIKYFYCETEAWQTTYADGTETLEFPNGQIEKKYSDGTSEIKFPDGVVRKIMSDGREEIKYLDGSVVTVEANGDRVLLLPNGQKEVHTKEHKRREYPDGTVKILYPDGTQETRYSNGRIRIKDGEGKLLMDSFS